MSVFENIKVIIWDFDGTLYKPNLELFAAVRESEYKTIMDLKKWTHDQAVAEFGKYYKKVTPSATQTVAKICGISTTEAALIMEQYYDRRLFLSRDENLIKLFRALAKYEHYILANGVKERIRETLEILGIEKNIFSEIVTSEIVGENKPSDKGFKYILKKTGLPPEVHLMVGDREAVDLIPAKLLGIRTCLVWSDKKSDNADITIPTVYELEKFL